MWFWFVHYRMITAAYNTLAAPALALLCARSA